MCACAWPTAAQPHRCPGGEGVAVVAVGFGNRQTHYMALAWGTAFGVTLLFIEPLQIVILAAVPCLFDEETRVGRCCLRCRFWYNELVAP